MKFLLLQSINRKAGLLGIVGALGVLAYNWRLWQRDQALATRLRQERAEIPKLEREPRVSALVAAWNEGERIEAHLRSFEQLSYPHIELILCAGGGDDTLARARRHAGPQVLVLEQRAGEGKQRALARCLEHASGEVVYLTDADCIFSDEALARLLDPLVNDGEQVATGCVRPLAEQSDKLLPSYLWSIDVVAAARRPLYTNGLLGANTAVMRSALDRIGGLAFQATTGTDYQLAQRLVERGFAIRHISASVVASEYPESFGLYRRRQSRWLRNLLLYGVRYKAWNDLHATIKTVGSSTLMLLAPLAAFLAGPLALVVWCMLLLHAVLAKVRYALFVARVFQQPLSLRNILALGPLTVANFVVCSSTLIDLLSRKGRQRWT